MTGLMEMLRLLKTFTLGLTLAGLLALGGCASMESLSDMYHGFSAERPVQVKVQSCVDRTGYAGRDLGHEAMVALIEKLKADAMFDVRNDGRYVLTCDISAFAEGSALKRWIMPGWGATVGQVAVMVMDSKSGETVAIVRGNATVASGGLYTVGADQYILRSALDEVVKKLHQVVSGAAPDK